MGLALAQPVSASTKDIDDNEEDLSNGLVTRSSSNYSVLELPLNLVCFVPRESLCIVDRTCRSRVSMLLELIPDRTRPSIPVIILTHLNHPNLFEMAKIMARRPAC
jgi:hypothetical protein